MKEIKYLTVSALNRYIAYKIDSDVALNIIYIKGEVSNARISKGHLYFILKDEESEISAIIFSNILRNSNYVPKDGAKVLITGQVSSYSKKGTYNLIVNKISEFGQGLIYQQFLELKERLEREGLFAIEHKKPIPKYSERISVVTSETGDALQDIRSTIQNRFPLAQIFLYKALVQGNDAPQSLISALKRADNDRYGDVIIIARGGGSIEDLNCFNDEDLARTIYDLKTPIVSGVGHENDYTICDFVCDDRAPTPTGAAVKVTPDKNILIQDLNYTVNRIKNALVKKYEKLENNYNSLINSYYFKSFDKVIDEKINNLNYLRNKLESYSPINLLNNYHIELNNLIKRIEVYNIDERIEKLKQNVFDKNEQLNKSFANSIIKYQNKFVSILDKLILVNPLNIMKKGYTLVYKNNSLVTASNQLSNNDEVKIQFSDGSVKAIITTDNK